MKAWINGEFVDGWTASVPILSHSFSRGSAIFEVVDIVTTSKGPAYFGLREHVDRFFNSAKYTMMELPMTKEEIIDACIETARESGTTIGAAKFFAYYPSVGFGLVPRDNKVDIAIFCSSWGFTQEGLKEMSKPIPAIISSYRKIHPGSVPVHAKVTGNYVSGYVAKMEASKRGNQEIILLDTEGFVAESATANLFIVKDGIIMTPTLRSVLPGINRMVVLELCKDMGHPTEERDILPEELLECDEAFFTASTIKALPIKSIDDKLLGEPCPGPATKMVMDTIQKVLDNTPPEYEKWLINI